MPHHSTGPAAAAAAPTSARFSPGVVRRVLSPLARAVVPRLLRRQQDMRASQFAALDTAPGQVVMLGDSITVSTPTADWSTRPVSTSSTSTCGRRWPTTAVGSVRPTRATACT